MGFNLVKAFTRAVGIPDKYSGFVGAAVPFLGPTQLAVNFVTGQKLSTGFVPTPQSRQLAPNLDAQAPGSQFIIQQVPGSSESHYSPYYQPTYSGSYFDTQGYGPYAGYGGQNPWDYSTSPVTYSVVQTPVFQTYSPPSQGSSSGIWEDLLPLALAFL